MSEQTGGPDGPAETDEETYRAEIAVLREENRRLREEYARARRSEYRRAALLLSVAGVLAFIGGLLVSSARTVLFALGGTGVFVAVVTYYLTPERLVPATVGRAVYTSMAETYADVVSELGLTDDRVYVPVDGGSVRLFVPHHTAYDCPTDVSGVFVIGNTERDRGIAVRPTGMALFEEFEKTRAESFGPDEVAMARQLSTALVEQFELLDGAAVDGGEDQVTVAVSGSVYGPVERFDHPVVSLLASGLASGLDRPVSASVTDDTDRADALVTCRWKGE